MLSFKANSCIQRRFVISPAWKKSLFLWLIYFISVGLGKKDGVKTTPGSWLWILVLSKVWRASVNFGHLASLHSKANSGQLSSRPSKVFATGQPSDLWSWAFSGFWAENENACSLAGAEKGKPAPGLSGAMRRAQAEVASHPRCILFTLTFPAPTHWWAHGRHSINKYDLEGRMKWSKRKNEIQEGSEKQGVRSYRMWAVWWGRRDKHSTGWSYKVSWDLSLHCEFIHL